MNKMATKTRFACSQCQQLVEFEWSSLKEEEWREFQTCLAGVKDSEDLISGGSVDPSAKSRVMDASFVFISDRVTEELASSSILAEAINNAMSSDIRSDSVGTSTAAAPSSISSTTATIEREIPPPSPEIAGITKKGVTGDGDSPTSPSSASTADASKAKRAEDRVEWSILDTVYQVSTGMADLTHPLCSVCLSKVNEELDRELEEVRSDQRAYSEVTRKFESELRIGTLVTSPTSDEGGASPPGVGAGAGGSGPSLLSPDSSSIGGGGGSSTMDTEPMEVITRLRRHNTRDTHLVSETHKLQLELIEIQKERRELEKEFAELDRMAEECDGLESDYLMDANDFSYAIANLSTQNAAVRERMREVCFHLDSVKRTNVFDDAFHISYAGHFGTINGLRLGRLPVANVDWDERNAGFGQCVLLLDVLTKRCSEFVLKRYELIPLGSHSCIREKRRLPLKEGSATAATVIKHEMYGSDRLLGSKECDSALVCFLDCLLQFSHWICSKDECFRLPYSIELPDLIGEKRKKRMFSVKSQLNEDEYWTMSLKFMLTDLKCLLAWVARYNP